MMAEHAWFADRAAPDIAFDTTPGREDGTHLYCGIPLLWSYVQKRMMTMILDSMYGRVIAGHVWSGDGPAIFLGTEEPESFVDPCAVNG